VLHLVAVLALAVFEAVVALAIVLALRVARALVIVVANLLALVVLLLVAVIAFAIIERIIAIAAVLALRVSRADEIIVALRLVFLAVVAAFPDYAEAVISRAASTLSFELSAAHIAYVTAALVVTVAISGLVALGRAVDAVGDERAEICCFG